MLPSERLGLDEKLGAARARAAEGEDGAGQGVQKLAERSDLFGALEAPLHRQVGVGQAQRLCGSLHLCRGGLFGAALEVGPVVDDRLEALGLEGLRDGLRVALALDGLVEPVQYVVFSASLERFVRVVLQNLPVVVHVEAMLRPCAGLVDDVQEHEMARRAIGK